ncbi:MAG: NAD-dependent epimerase/dehydratase family protein [Bradymonadales bacterium]|nr:NAD-dependent epimerase/dehydratase family protein [Bradymonadales bacterium]
MNQSERVLVTGGAGFIGSHLCQRLLARGSAVCCLDNFDPAYDPAIKERNLAAIAQKPSFLLVRGDILDPGALDEAFAFQPDTVIHLAALAGVRDSIAQPARTMLVNVVGTTNLLEACCRHGVRRFLFGSSSSVYGDRKQVPFSEEDRVDDPQSPYAASKKAGELACYSYHALYAMDITCLRFFTVYGPRQRPEMAIHRFVRAILAGQPVTLYGDGSSSRDYTYIDDCLDGITAALDRLEGYRLYNLGESVSIRLDRLVATIEAVTGKEAIRIYLPNQAGDVTTTFANIDRARRDLGYQPAVGIEQGIRSFVQWFQEQTGLTGQPPLSKE